MSFVALALAVQYSRLSLADCLALSLLSEKNTGLYLTHHVFLSSFALTERNKG